MTREEFEREFNSRTLAYHPEYRSDDRPVVVVFSNEAHNEPGHALVVTLVNQLARAHRRIVLVGDFERPLLCVDHFGLAALDRATKGLAEAINPFIEVEIRGEIPPGEKLFTLGVGDAGCDLNLGADRWVAVVGANAPINPVRTSILGACLAACLAAAAAFHRVLGDETTPDGNFSLWGYARQSDAQGRDFVGPVDVGRVLQVGAGAVGSGFAYFLKFFGFAGDMVICDGDDVDVSNLNRQLYFLAADAGYPDSAAHNKAELLAERLCPPAGASPVWYGEDDRVVRDRFDLVLPLANEYAARPALQQRPQTVLLHGTTSSNWEAQVHRHVAGRDGCICCRLPEIPTGGFGCAEGTVGREQRQDASLPFLASTASLLLLAEVIRLQEGALLDSERNYRAVGMKTPIPTTQELRYPCSDGCRFWMPAPRRLDRTAGSRFADLDGDIGSDSAAARESTQEALT
jgi:hypothetical protein